MATPLFPPNVNPRTATEQAAKKAQHAAAMHNMPSVDLVSYILSLEQFSFHSFPGRMWLKTILVMLVLLAGSFCVSSGTVVECRS